MFALSLGFSQNQAKKIRKIAVIHDIGKKKIPGSILNKPGKLSPAEFEIMKTHTQIGAQMLSGVKGEVGVMARAACEYHHEWHNGGGYWGIPTCRLPDYIPIISIADVFVACCAKRAYKDPWPPEQVLEYLRSRAGRQFSKGLINDFIQLIRENKDVPVIFSKTNI